MAARYQQFVRAGAYQLAEAAAGKEAFQVPVTFHVVRLSNGTAGLSETRVAQALADANAAYAGSGIQFCQAGATIYIDSDAFFFDIDTQAEINQLKSTDPVPQTVNVYCTEFLSNEGGGLCGQSSFTFSGLQGIVQRNSCTGTSSNPSTFPHELGHYFDLFHTHETSFGVECTSGSNCSFAGDQICDTPADPNLSGQVNSSCLYIGNAAGPCVGDPPYNPDPANYMSYSLKVCRDMLTPQQQNKAYATLVNLRPDLIGGCCSGSPRLYVKTGAAVSGCGGSWTDATDMRTALNIAAGSGGLVEEIWVAAGTYTPSSIIQEATFQLVSGVSVYGGFTGVETQVGQRDWTTNATVLSGDLSGDDGPGFTNYIDNSYHVVTGSGTDGTAVLDGFIIEAGNATGDCGSAMRNDGGSPTVINCIFRANLGTFGGAMCNDESSPTVINCSFTGNLANSAIGGAMRNIGGNPTVISCSFTDNTAGFGGAVGNEDSNATVINCTFVGNVASLLGGGIYNYQGAPTVTNCTFSGNTASVGSGIYNIFSTPTVTNTIVWANGPGEIFDDIGAMATVSYSNVQGGWAGAGSGNIDDDPLFVELLDGDLRLLQGSPCIDAGDNNAVPMGILTDLDGNPRFHDDSGTADTGVPGNGHAQVVDMGAYEFQGTSPVACPWNCGGDNDGNVGIADFLTLLAQWGGPGACDVDGDGVVGINDFLDLLANWGPCP